MTMKVGAAAVRPQVVNQDDIQVWGRVDPESVRNKEGGIHHGESIKLNGKAIGDDLARVFIPDRLEGLFRGDTGMKVLAGIFCVPIAIAEFISDLGWFILMLFKHLGDMVAHAIQRDINRKRGINDGVADEQSVRRSLRNGLDDYWSNGVSSREHQVANLFDYRKQSDEEDKLDRQGRAAEGQTGPALPPPKVSVGVSMKARSVSDPRR